VRSCPGVLLPWRRITLDYVQPACAGAQCVAGERLPGAGSLWCNRSELVAEAYIEAAQKHRPDIYEEMLARSSTPPATGSGQPQSMTFNDVPEAYRKLAAEHNIPDEYLAKWWSETQGGGSNG